MKKRILFGMVSLACLLSACQTTSRDAAQGGDDLYGPAESYVSQSSLDEATRQRYEALEKAHQFYKQLTGITLTTDVEYEGATWRYQTNSQQVYQEGSLQGFRTHTSTRVADQTDEIDYFYDGQHHYVQASGSDWEQNDNAKTSMTYLYWVKLLIEGGDDLSLEEGSEGQVILTKQVTDTELLAPLLGLLDLPKLVLDQAQYQAQLSYTMDLETGQLLKMGMTLQVTEGDQVSRYHAESESQVPSTAFDLEALKPDLTAKAQPADVSEEDWLERFKQANPVKAMTTYEVTEGRQTGDQDQNSLHLVNVQEGQVVASAVGIIDNQQIQSYDLIKGTSRYHLSDDGKVSQESISPIDYYGWALATFIEHYSETQILEANSDDQEDSASSQETKTTYRQTFENDFDRFQALGQNLDLSNLKREEQALYGVDYVVNKTTLRLEGIYFWSLTADETSIQYVNRFVFRHFNQSSPVLIRYIIGENLLKAVTD